MKKNILAACLVVLCCLNCKDDEDPAYSFKDQNLQGKIANEAWTHGDGYAEDQGANDLYIRLVTTQTGGNTGCNLFTVGGNEVFFTVPKAVGVYQLKFDLSGGSGQTVTLFERDGFVNHIASTGAVEILSISSTEVSGRIDARIDGESSVNGNFTVVICP